jgi:apolipoprotein N-acyltransferase
MATAAAHHEPRRQKKAVQSKPMSTELDPSIQSIINKGRQQHAERLAAVGTWVLPGATAGLLWACFTPLDFGPLAWVALVPLCMLIRATNRTRKMYRSLYLFGFVWSAVTLQWMRLGHISMYVALAALSAYIAFYFPVFVGLSRVAVHRFKVPLAFAVPVVWTGLEFLRAHIMTGFSWYYLGHSQWRWVELIQISDLVGAYGVSFIVALANAGLASVIPLALFRKLQLVSDDAQSGVVGSNRPLITVAVCVAVLASAVGYGFQRRSAANFKQGARVALIQGDFPSEVKANPERATDIVRKHDELTLAAMQYGLNDATAAQRPELVIWPESMFPWPMFDVEEGVTDQELLRLRPPNARTSHEAWIQMFRSNEAIKRVESDARTFNAAMLLGMNSIRGTRDGEEQRNSVAFVTPTGLQGRYDKMHLVMFGEYVPLKDKLPLLSRLTPYGSQHGIEAGTKAKVFDYAGYRFSPVICFEDTVPHLVRGLVKTAEASGKQLDFLVNNTNDGWFHGSSELDQHLITAAFRCVETRTPMVRAVNTGVSAFIDGDGVIREPDVFIDGDNKNRKFLQENGRWSKQLNAALIDNVPLDDRTSFYVRTGDVFAGSCGLACLLLLGVGFVDRRRAK